MISFTIEKPIQTLSFTRANAVSTRTFLRNCILFCSLLSLSTAANLRLSPESLSGPDGVILLEDRSEITVQVTLSKEHGDGYKKRLNLRDRSAIKAKTWNNRNEMISERLERIIDAIREKEINFRDGTKILLIVDESISSWGDVLDPGLPNAIQESLASLPPSKYSATFVIFGEDVRQMR